jgi:hypothetical protein
MVHFLDVGMLSFAAPNHGYWLLPFTVKGGRNQTPVFSPIGTKLGFML